MPPRLLSGPCLQKAPDSRHPPHGPRGERMDAGALQGTEPRRTELKSRARALTGRPRSPRPQAGMRQWKKAALKIAAKGPAGLSAVPGPGLPRGEPPFTDQAAPRPARPRRPRWTPAPLPRPRAPPQEPARDPLPPAPGTPSLLPAAPQG